MPTARKRLWIAAALVTVYIGTVALTLGVRGTHLRPLYEGFGPSAPYRWVNPPGVFAATNQKPTSITASVPLGPKGSVVTGIQTPDAQVVLGMADGAVAAHDHDTSIQVVIVPLDAAKLGPLPGSLYANGNAYRISMTYEPSHTPVARLAKPGSMTIQIPGIGHSLFTSTDGHTWKLVESHNIQPTGLIMGTIFATPGYYLGGTTVAPPAPAGSSGSSVAKTAIGAGALAAIVLAATALLVRRRRRRNRGGDPAPGGEPPA
jgi:uncharacterized protein (TIGR03382 family)